MVDIIAKGFYEVMEEGRSLDQVSSHWIKQNPDWNSFTKGFFAESLMEVVRWWRLLETSVNITLGVKVKDSYRLMVLTYFLIKAKDERVNEFFQSSLRDDILKYYQQIKDNRTIAESIPDWLDSMAVGELGDSWNNEIKALNFLPPLF